MFGVLLLCFVAFVNADEILLSQMTHSVTSKIETWPRMSGWGSTGCRISKVTFQITCEDSKTMIGHKQAVPERTFRTVVDCKSMNDKVKSVTFHGGDCAKLVFTQQEGNIVSLNRLELQKGQVANITCVPFPFGGFWNPYFSVALEVTARDRTFDKDSPQGRWEIGRLNYGIRDEDKKKEEQCGEAVKQAFKWKLILTNSLKNVHDLLWTSQPEAPTEEIMPEGLKTALPAKSTSCLKDVAFKELDPSISIAPDMDGISSDHAMNKDGLQLQMLDAPRDLEVPGKHEEKVKVLVDATQLPSHVKTLKVRIVVRWPDGEVEWIPLELPVENPNLPDQPDRPDLPDLPDLPDSGPEAASFNWTPVIVILVLCLMALGVGAFLYRRNLLIQAHAREVLS